MAWVKLGDPRAHGSLLSRSGAPADAAGTTGALVDRSFRHEYGRLVAALTRATGAENLELGEDAAQAALAAALTAWVRDGPPDDPAAWLYRVAHRHLLAELRQRGRRARILDRSAGDLDAAEDRPEAPLFAHEVRDDLLRMLFVCCDGAIPRDARLVLAMKTLCGFSVEEIALRLFTSEASVYKRIERARERLREAPPDLATPAAADIRARLPDVHAVLYLLFNEGYLSAREDEAIRRELCDEAIRLATVLAEHPVGAVPETFALLALMHFHAARLPGRADEAGDLLLLDEQDRSRWDRDHTGLGAAWLERSAAGEVFSRFHAEAAIAAEHCFAPSFAETRWREIAELYAMLDRVAPSPTHALGRALAVAEWQGPAAGLAALDGVVPPGWLERSYLWDAVLADLHGRVGNLEAAAEHRQRAMEAAPSAAVRELIGRRGARFDGR